MRSVRSVLLHSKQLSAHLSEGSAEFDEFGAAARSDGVGEVS